MKALPQLPPQLELNQGGPRFWRSLEEWSESSEFLPYLHREFPEHASEWVEGLSRRRFLQLMAASFALAGITSCSRQEQGKLMPYARRPEEIIPGKPIFYATTFPHRGYGKGVLVRTEMGRPTKIEGNPDHPASLGSSDTFMQASILGLYDPDRSQAIRRGQDISDWDAFARFAGERVAEHEKDQGAGLFLLTGKTTSPSFLDELQRMQERFPRMTWCEYEPAAPVRAHAKAGTEVEPCYDLRRADLIVSLDADFLGEGPANLTQIKAFSERRRNPEKDFNRLYVIESVPSITGAKADCRWRRKPSDIVVFAEELAGALLHGALPTSRQVAQLVRELQDHRGTSLIMAGDYQPEVIHALAFQLNRALGNIGSTVNYFEAPLPPVEKQTPLDFILSLHQREVKTLLIEGCNPAYDFPANMAFAQGVSRVPHSIHLGLYEDETAALCIWHLPESHYLESWGDITAFDGTTSVIQPLIEKLYPSTTSLSEVVSLFVDLPPQSGYDIVHNFWQRRMDSAASNGWRDALRKGIIENVAARIGPVTVSEVIAIRAPQPPAAASLEILFRPDAAVDDGRYANNAWLQELPRPMTKLTWDNVAMVSPASAEVLGVKSGDVVIIETQGGSVEAPVWIQPGHADQCVSVTLGYGRTKAGNVANGVGFNANLIRFSAHPWSLLEAKMTPTGRMHTLATTQHHFNMEGRGLIQIQTLADFLADPKRAQENIPDPKPAEDVYPPFEYKNHAWAMSIDLNTCVGCNACIVACQSENNISVVGRDQVNRGREMHWIRVDRYFEGSPEDPAVHFQPVTCMQCEQAPCEVVCPVAATVHSSEGLNDMVYNRCVGTRYCSNNCPYKVRRFNFLSYDDEMHPTIALQRNPDVTVRTRGVMEKCTYCVQRIEAVRIDAEKEMRPIRDGEIVTACQSACPAEAIVFGDKNDPSSRVSRLRAQPRNYSLLAELNTHPRTTYLEKIINPSIA